MLLRCVIVIVQILIFVNIQAKSMNAFIIIYITHPDLKTAKKICGELLKRRLIACVNYIPIESAYWWCEKIENAKEIVSIVKTRKENWTQVRKAVEAIHPYQVPCIMKFNVEANTSYAEWIKKETLAENT